MTVTTEPSRPRLGVFKFSSCDGCQLQLLNCEDEFLAVTGAVDIVHFPEASSRLNEEGPFDVVLVEGSITTDQQLAELKHLRQRTTHLVAIGACATAGGIQALRNFRNIDEMVRSIYADPATIDALATSTPLSDHVTVDQELRGCPVDKAQLIELITALLVGRRPAIRDESVCAECKRRLLPCVMVVQGTPCLGPVTHAGCGALCPRFDRGCFGCFGPREQANTTSLAARLAALGLSEPDIQHRFRGFTCWAEAFRHEGTPRASAVMPAPTEQVAEPRRREHDND